MRQNETKEPRFSKVEKGLMALGVCLLVSVAFALLNIPTPSKSFMSLWTGLVSLCGLVGAVVLLVHLCVHWIDD